jgi:uncharacterized membrane protein
LIGTSISYTLALVNLSSMEDSFDIEITGNAWQTSAPPGPIGPLSPGGSVTVTVTVTVPESALHGDQDVATITVISQGDPARTATAVISTTARVPVAYFPLVQK